MTFYQEPNLVLKSSLTPQRLHVLPRPNLPARPGPWRSPIYTWGQPEKNFTSVDLSHGRLGFYAATDCGFAIAGCCHKLALVRVFLARPPDERIPRAVGPTRPPCAATHRMSKHVAVYESDLPEECPEPTTQVQGGSYRYMTKSEIHVIRRALELLNQLVPQDQMPNKGDPAPGHCPVRRFAQEYLAPDPTTDVSCEELWCFFREIAEAGELPPLRKAGLFGPTA